MFKKFFLAIMISLSFQSIYFGPLAAMMSDDGVLIEPKQNFDQIEFGLEMFDYLVESLEIATLGSESETNLNRVYSLAIGSKILVMSKELFKLKLRQVFNHYYELNKNSYGEQDEKDLLFKLFISVMAELVVALKNGDIDSLGIFKIVSHLGCGILNVEKLLKVKDIVKHAKDHPIERLNHKKWLQFGWLSLNKFMPTIVSLVFNTIKYGGEVGLHYLTDSRDFNRKSKSSLYRYSCFIAEISELLRKYHQARIMKSNQINVGAESFLIRRFGHYSIFKFFKS